MKATYVKEAYNELVHKVTWPTWTSLQNSMIASLILALVILAMDISFESIMKGIYSILY